ncbi:MAG: hypothetical protein GF418_15045, partial [Chitinivibrionales bacterium]|nr:hypothetical protein [Chitinivibrionales bacterium]MBD3396937.1 hypothetical protein [Chitinivibrionales bacterium]
MRASRMRISHGQPHMNKGRNVKRSRSYGHAQYQPLSRENVGRIHEVTLQTFEEVGFEVHNDEAWDLFRKTTAHVDSTRRIVRLRESTVNELLSTVPSEVVLYGRSEKHDISLGTDQVYFGTGGTALNILEYDTQTSRRANLQDLVNVVRITDRLDNIHLMLLPTYPNELPIDRVDVNRFYAGLQYTSKHIMGGVYTSKGINDVIAMAE